MESPQNGSVQTTLQPDSCSNEILPPSEPEQVASEGQFAGSSVNDVEKVKLEALSTDEEQEKTLSTRSLHVVDSDKIDMLNMEGSKTVPSNDSDVLGELIVHREGGSPHFKVKIEGDIEIVAPLDLGAEATIVTRELLQEMVLKHPEIKLIPGCARLYNASNGQVKTHGRCWLNLTFGKHTLCHPMYVCDINTPLLIGSDVLWRLSSVIDMVNGVLRSGLDNIVPFHSEWKGVKSVQVVPQVCDVEVAETTLVPKFTDAQRIRVRMAKNQDIGDRDGTIQVAQAIVDLGLQVLDCVVPTCRQWFWVYVRNAQARDVTLNKFKKLGKVVALDTPAFEADIIVVGDKLIKEEQSNDETQEDVATVKHWMRQGENFMVRRIQGIHGDPVSSEEVASCVVNDEGLVVTLKDICDGEQVSNLKKQELEKGRCCLDHVDRATEQVEIGVSQVDDDIDRQIDEVVKTADAADECQKEQLRDLLMEFKQVFSRGKNDVGLTNIHEVRIPTNDNDKPAFTRQYKIPWASYESVRGIISELESKGIIRPCNSTYNSPIWPVLKPNKTWRMCIDFRNLNKKVPISRWPMGDMDRCVSRLKNSKFFSTLDVANGFWTLPVHPEDQYKLAFSFDNRQYTWTRMPFGYVNSPAEWNIFLHKVLPDVYERHLSLFVDDILANSQEWTYHLSQLRYVLERLSSAGVKISIHKCQFAKTAVDYLGYHLSSNGVSPQVQKIESIEKLKDPTNVSQLRSLLGTFNFYRRFIEGYAELTEPLQRLLKKNVQWSMGEPERQVIRELKNKLCNAPILAYPQFFPGAEFTVESTFTNNSISGILSQTQDGKDRVIAYASKCLNASEQQYSDCEKSCYATTWTILHFKHYLCGYHAIIKTAHHPVSFLSSKKNQDGLSGRVTRWALILQGQSFEVKYAKNRNMKNVEGLAELHDCDNAETEHPIHLHRKWDSAVSHRVERVYADGCCVLDEEGENMAGAGVYWPNEDMRLSKGYQLGNKSSQYAELAAAMIAIEQAVDRKLTEIVVCSDSEYVVKTFHRVFVPLVEVWNDKW